MNLSTADPRNYWTEFHETWWSYRYMILVDPKVFSFVVKGIIKIITRNGAKTISLPNFALFGRLNNKKRSKNNKSPNVVWET
jgi:hypothetical protein